jgi:hypothetical protein
MADEAPSDDRAEDGSTPPPDTERNGHTHANASSDIDVEEVDLDEDYENADGGDGRTGNDNEASDAIDAEKLRKEVARLQKEAKRERAAALKELNDKFFVVNDGGSVLIYSERFDDAFGRRVHDRLSQADLRLLYANRRICVRVTDKGKRKFAKLASWWLVHELRRQFINGVVFKPGDGDAPLGFFNLWCGFAYQPKLGSWEKLKRHIRDVVCRGSDEHFMYLVGWMARLVQRPCEPAEVAIVLRGDQGCGKGTLGHALRKILGQHGLHISNSKHLIGNFNQHLRDCVFLFADEAFFAGDKAGIGTLKALITEGVMMIEAKFVNATMHRNCLHIVMASNSDWVVPAGLNERRFFCLDVPSDRIDDHAYFQAIHEEMGNGGYEAMLHELLNYDISGFNVRKMPATTGLQEQKKLSLDTTHAWWQEVLARGYVFRSELGLEEHFHRWHSWTSTEILYESYIRFAKGRGERRPLSRESLGRFLATIRAKPSRPRGMQVVGEHLNSDRVPSLHTQKQPRGYSLGTLEQARQAFGEATRLTFTWEPAGEGSDLDPDDLPC